MAHLSDLDWLTPGEEALKKFRKGDEVKAKVLTVDVEKERIGLGLKQLDDDPFQGAEGRRGQTVTCTVTAVHEHSVEVEIFGSLPATSSARTSPATAPSSAPRVSRRATRSTPSCCRSTAQQARVALHQGPGSAGREAGDGGVRLDRQRGEPR